MPAFGVTVKACQAMASTKCGLRRILKQKSSVIDYIRNAVETGVYRTEAELAAVKKERRESTEDLRTIMARFRQDIIRGSYIHDYPTEYLILEQHPPIPDPPRTPVKYLKRLLPPPNPVEKLTKQYLGRQIRGAAKVMTAEEYYRRLLGVQAAQDRSQHHTAMSQKSASIQKAYAAAVKHYELVRSEGLSNAEAMKRVDELLASAAVKEETVARQRTAKISKWRKERSENPEKDLPFAVGKKELSLAEGESEHEENLEETLGSIFNASPRAAEAMMRWSERLKAVPYQQWTVGASTAMDHWIARQLLGFSEETWQLVLEGDDDSDPTLLSKGRDIVAVREALFPETVLELPKETKEEEEDTYQFDDKFEEKPDDLGMTDGGKSIDDLLKSLGGLTSPDAPKTEDKPKVAAAAEEGWKYLGGAEDYGEEGDLDTKVEKLVNELQAWRRRHMEEPYDKWIDAEKERFDRWMKQYIQTVASHVERSRIDYDTTREALLSEPPIEEHESEAFWSQLQDYGEAKALLDKMVKDGPPPGASILHSSFWELPRKVQLRRLLNLGALRPLLDEYTKESDRLRFLQRYGDTILSGVELEHLVPDPTGPVQASDIGEDVVRALKITEGSRFRLEMIPYRGTGDISDMEKSRTLFRGWNEHKAGRARYEEKLFQTGRLGLRYGDEPEQDE